MRHCVSLAPSHKAKAHEPLLQGGRHNRQEMPSAENVPSAHRAQERSVVGVQRLLSYWPGGHGGWQLMQGVAGSLSWSVVSAVHNRSTHAPLLPAGA